MSLVSVVGVSKDFGIKSLFSDITLTVDEDERIAIVGANGSGKSTLLKLIVGLDSPDHGDIVRKRGLEISFVAQNDDVPEDSTLLYWILDGAHLPEHEIVQLCHASGLEDVYCSSDQMSGGQKKRASVLKALAKQSELLVLDEPTNHLDIPGILWLEEALINYKGAVLFVSHDRYFIERVASKTIEIDSRFSGGYLSEIGGYSAIVEKREHTLSSLETIRSSLANKVRREVEWLRAGVKARTTKAKYRSDEAKRLIDELNSMQLERKTVELGFAATNRRTKELIRLDKVSGGYDDKVLFKDITTVLYPGSRIGIVGGNGSGKTTLLKTIIGELPVLKGKIHRASNLEIRYFSQMREDLSDDVTVKEFIAPDSDSVIYQNNSIHVASWMKRFLFTTDHLSMPVSQLSGGEQARLLLSKLSLYPADVLVFDEPTNDLDIPTLSFLEDSLTEFPGAVLLVSHDRYLVGRVATEILGFTGAATTIQCADYTQFEIAWDEARTSNKSSSKQIKNQSSQKPSELSYQDKKELQSLERKISTQESKIQKLEESLLDPAHSANMTKLVNIQEEIEQEKLALDDLFERWANLEAMK